MCTLILTLVSLCCVCAARAWAGEMHDATCSTDAPRAGDSGTTEATSWSFRGDPQLTGVASSALPGRLEVRWKFERTEAFASSAAIAGGVVYVGCDDEHFYALDLSNGKVKWKFRAAGPVQSSPIVLDQRVVFGDDEGVVRALDRADGRELWKFTTEGQVISSPNHHAGRIVVGSYDGFLYCLSADTGTLLWKYETAGYVHGSPAIARDHALAVGCDERLHVVRLSDGKAARTIPIGSPSGVSPAVSGSRAFFGTYGGRVLAVDWESGKSVWVFEDPDREFPFMASAAVTRDFVIVGGRDKRLHCLDILTGKTRWTFVSKGRIDSSAIVVGRRVFFGSMDGNLYAVGLDDGKELWRFEAGSPITASPAVASRCLVVGTLDGVLYCFGSRRDTGR